MLVKYRGSSWKVTPWPAAFAACSKTQNICFLPVILKTSKRKHDWTIAALCEHLLLLLLLLPLLTFTFTFIFTSSQAAHTIRKDRMLSLRQMDTAVTHILQFKDKGCMYLLHLIKCYNCSTLSVLVIFAVYCDVCIKLLNLLLCKCTGVRRRTRALRAEFQPLPYQPAQVGHCCVGNHCQRQGDFSFTETRFLWKYFFNVLNF